MKTFVLRSALVAGLVSLCVPFAAVAGDQSPPSVRECGALLMSHFSLSGANALNDCDDPQIRLNLGDILACGHDLDQLRPSNRAFSYEGYESCIGRRAGSKERTGFWGKAAQLRRSHKSIVSCVWKYQYAFPTPDQDEPEVFDELAGYGNFCLKPGTTPSLQPAVLKCAAPIHAAIPYLKPWEILRRCATKTSETAAEFQSLQGHEKKFIACHVRYGADLGRVFCDYTSTYLSADGSPNTEGLALSECFQDLKKSPLLMKQHAAGGLLRMCEFKSFRKKRLDYAKCMETLVPLEQQERSKELSPLPRFCGEPGLNRYESVATPTHVGCVTDYVKNFHITVRAATDRCEGENLRAWEAALSEKDRAAIRATASILPAPIAPGPSPDLVVEPAQ